MAVSSLTALAVKVAEEWDRKALGLIWSVNSFPQQYRPSLKPSPLTKDGIQAVGALFTGVSKATGLWESDVATRVAILRAAGMDYDIDAQTAAAGVAAKAAENAATMPKATFGGQPPAPADPGADQ